MKTGLLLLNRNLAKLAARKSFDKDLDKHDSREDSNSNSFGLNNSKDKILEIDSTTIFDLNLF